MIVTISGANDFARRAALDDLTTAFVAEHGDLAVERLDGEGANAEQLHESLQSLPFLSARKLIILREPGQQKAFAEHIADTIKDIADTNDVIFYEPKIDKRSSYYKTLKKATDFREFFDLDAAELVKWTEAYAQKEGGSLAAADARLLLDRVGASQQLVHSELDKLLAYDPHITRQTIELLTERTPQSTIFELLDAAFAGNTARAFTIYREQRALRVEPQAIIAMIAWQLHVLALVKSAGPRSVSEIAQEAKINPFVVRKAQALGRQLTLAHISQLAADLLALDIRLKSMAIDADEATQLYLLQLATVDN